MSKISNVSFLGPILEKTAFELMLEQKPRLKRTVYSAAMPLGNIVLSHEEKMLDKVRFEDPYLTNKVAGVRLDAKDLIENFKYIPPFQKFSIDVEQEKAREAPRLNPREENFIIEGPLAKREILFKPELPMAAERVGAGQEVFVVELKFKVSSAGKVEEVMLLASSGYPDIDILAINHIKGLKFSSSTTGDEPIWGKVTISLRTK